MSQLRSPIILRLTLWFLVLSLIPIGTVFFFVQSQIRENIISTQMEIMRDHARIYSARMETEGGQEQALAVDMMISSANGDVFFLLARNGTYLAHSLPDKVGRSALEDLSFDTLQKLLARESTTILDDDRQLLIGSYRTSLTGPLAVTVARLPDKVATLNLLTRNILVQLFFALAVVVVGAGAAVLTILRPLVKLADYATEISRGNFDAQFDDRRLSGEVARLSSSLKSLTASVQSSIGSLESRVHERTLELERRSKL